jgi:hypothetical protein
MGHRGAVLITTSTVLLIAGQVTGALTVLASTQPPPAPASTAPPSSAPRSPTVQPQAPAGWRTVSFGRASVQVPAAWPVVDLDRHPSTCPRLDVHAVYLGTPGPAPRCPARLLGRTEAVQIQPASQQDPAARQAQTTVRVGGMRALTNADYLVTHVLTYQPPAGGMRVSVSYGDDRSLAAAIAATIRFTAAPSAGTGPAARQPGPARIQSGPARGHFSGAGFDTCSAPAAGIMRRWLASRYRAIGIYIGGMNRACAQARLTRQWIAAIRAQGWRYFPIYVGRQASCVRGLRVVRIVPGLAATEGRAAARDARAQARGLGIPGGTPIIYDMEAYRGCGQEVTAFLSAWDAQLHREGFQAGVYESFDNVRDMVRRTGSMTEPDVIHYADWDLHGTTRSPYMPRHLWTGHRRIHQWRGPHLERYRGVTLDIDNDRLNVRLSRAAARHR